MNQKGIAPLIIVAIVAVVAVVAGVGIYVATRGDGGAGGGGGGGEGGVAGATSLDFKVDVTYGGQTQTMRERARNIGTANMDLRVDINVVETTMSWILSGSQQQGWVYTGAQWMSFSDLGYDFSTYWSQYYSGFTTYENYLGNWTEGEWSGTFGGYAYRIYDIQVNPSLPDSVFQPS